jgi:hypothetical protein
MLIRRYGGPEVFERGDIDAPQPGRGKVLIRVRGSSVNPVDCAIRSGNLRWIVLLRMPAVLLLTVFPRAGATAPAGHEARGSRPREPLEFPHPVEVFPRRFRERPAVTRRHGETGQRAPFLRSPVVNRKSIVWSMLRGHMFCVAQEASIDLRSSTPKTGFSGRTSL